MSFTWQAKLAQGSTTTEADLAEAGVGMEFEDQLDAEEWLTENFADLADLQVTSVILLDGTEEVYSMGLGAA